MLKWIPLMLLVTILFSLPGCASVKTMEDAAVFQQQVQTALLAAREAGMSGQAFVQMKLGPDIGSFKQSIEGPLTIDALLVIGVNPAAGEPPNFGPTAGP